MHFILLLKIIFAFRQPSPCCSAFGVGEEKREKNSVQLRFLFGALPGVSEPCLPVDTSVGLLPSSAVFPFVSGKVAEGTGCSCRVSAMHLQGARTTQNYRPSKDQRQREKKKKILAPKPGHLLEVIHYTNKKIIKINQTPPNKPGFCV